MIADDKPILFNTDEHYDEIELYILHDIHYGNECFNNDKWKKMKAEILSEPNRFVCFVGDAIENAVPGSKSDMFTQTCPPEDQKEWFAEQLTDLAERVLCVTDGNHENNRSTKMCGLYPLYDCCFMAGIKDRYRHGFALCDIGVGKGDHKGRQLHYVGMCTHRAKDLKSFNSADCIDGIDFFLFGHDHDPKDHPRQKMVYDSKNKTISYKSVEVINAGSFLDYGGYAVHGAYRPLSGKSYKLILSGRGQKKIQTIGFYL